MDIDQFRQFSPIIQQNHLRRFDFILLKAQFWYAHQNLEKHSIRLQFRLCKHATAHRTLACYFVRRTYDS